MSKDAVDGEGWDISAMTNHVRSVLAPVIQEPKEALADVLDEAQVENAQPAAAETTLQTVRRPACVVLSCLVINQCDVRMPVTAG